MIDTSVLVAGVAGFKSRRTVENPSASLLRDWLENGTFTWLITEDIVSEYKGVLTRLGVRRNLVGAIINLLREEAEFVDVRGQVTCRRIRMTTRFARVQSKGELRSSPP